MLFLLGLQHDSESILSDLGESENQGNPVIDQVDNFPPIDGEVGQPIYKGPQTWSCTKKLVKVNLLMNQLFDVNTGEICDDNDDIVDFDEHPGQESIRDLILHFGTNKYSQFIWSVVTWLKLEHIPLIASQDLC